MRVKKLLCVLLSAALVATSLAACGKSGGNTETTAKATEAEKTTAAAGDTDETDAPAGNPFADLPEANTPATPVAATPDMYDIDLSKAANVNMIMVGDKPNDWEAVNAAINEYLAPFNTTLSATFLSWSDYQEKYPLEVQDTTADIIYTASWCFLGSEADKGTFIELTDEFITANMPLTKIYQDPDSYAESLIGGKLYCIPQNMTEPSAKYVAVRQDLADKYDLSIADWNDYVNYLTTIAEKETPESGIYAYAAAGDNNELWDVYRQQYSYWSLVSDEMLQFNYIFDGENAPAPEDVELVYTGETFKNFCYQMKDLADAGVWSRSALQNDVSDDEAFGSLQGASVAWNSSLFTYVKQAEEAGAECAAYFLNNGAPTAAAYGAGGLAIGTMSKDKERAAMILDIMENDTFVNRAITLGIEGTHYEMLDESHYNELEKSSDFAIWALAASWCIKNYKLVEASMDARQQAVEAQIEAAAVPNPVRTFSFDSTSVTDEIANVKATLSAAVPALQLGLVDDVDAKIAELEKQLEADGIAAIQEELVKQYTEWYNAQ